MGFMDEYNKALQEYTSNNSGGGSTKSGGSVVKADNKVSAYESNYRNTLRQLQSESNNTKTVSGRVVSRITTKKKKKKDDKKSWFKKGVFEDGYQFGDISKAIVGTTSDIVENLGTGIMAMGEKAIDAAAYIAPYVENGQFYQNGGGYNLELQKQHEQAVEQSKKDLDKFIAKDLYNEEEIAKKIISGNYEKVFGNAMEDDSFLGDKSDSLVQSGGQLLGTAALSSMGVPWWATTAATSFGGEVENAMNQGASREEAGMSAAISAGAEILSEKLSGGISFGSKTLDDVLTKQIARGVSNKAVRTLAKLGLDMSGEGVEEVLSGAMSAIGQKITYADDKELNELFSKEDAWESFIGGSVLGGFSGTYNAIKSNANGVDYVSELTANEQKVVDKVYKDRVDEAKKNGKVDKAKIYDEVLRDMEKGYITTDEIESALGGDTYKQFKQVADWEDSLQKEFDTLNKMKQGDMTGEQVDRREALREQLKNVKATSSRTQLKNQLGEEVLGLVKGDRLIESYNERGRRSQRFEADLTKYDAKQGEIVKRAIDSGILNNTNRTHEFVDVISKISADKGVLFDFTNNAKLKESGFAVDGKQVNGYVTKDGITLNIDSSKAWQKTVGHEITHVLEGTELYTELQKTLFDYAESKKELGSRWNALKELYKDVKDADVNAELTADLVGEYLFTDEDFVKNLSTGHRNVFQKIYDEIKYLYKVATAGSKEARDLERIKKAFDKAYKESGKSQTGTKYSVSDKNIKDISTGYGYGETFYTMSYTQDGKVVATLEYGEYDGEANVKMIEVEPEYRRKGIATKLMQELQKKYPDSEINFGMSTPDGTKLLESITYDVTDEAVVADRQKLKDLQTELNELQEKLDILYDTENLTEEQETELHDLGDRWQEVYESIYELSEDLRGKKATRTFVKTDTKYSISDSNGKQLTKEQQDYFKDSKMRDENGSLKVMYHGSQDAGFHVFDSGMSDDGTSFFFVDRNDVAASYSGTTETYAPRVWKSAEDANNFLKELGFYGGHYGYEVVENNGKFTLITGGEEIATSEDPAEIYEEFCDYEGVGYGDANYKVYLNLKNPLEVDAGGRNWNNVSREYSQEVADRYNSLTAEEKAALTDAAEWGEISIFRDAKNNPPDAVTESAFAKMGDVNMYDLFTIAEDNFSEESIKQFAVKQMNTRDYAQKAKAEGYDGVIFKNIHDNGGYSNGSEGASTVAIAFDSNQIKSVANAKPTADPDIRYSLSDSNGRELSKEQSEYFKDSKIRDENGSLKVMYHGTPNGEYTIFRDGTYFTDSKEYADRYQNPGASSISTGKEVKNPKTFEVYLDIKKPFDIKDAEAREIYINDYIKGGNAMGINPYLSDAEYAKINSIDWTEGEDLREFLIENEYDYDGLVLDEGATGGYGDEVQSRGKSYVVFSPEQVKNADNKKPTSDPDIRYSLTEYTPEEKKEHNKAVLSYFGKTYKWAETGYVLLDGSKLDLSGKHEGAPGGYRSVDHRDIVDALGSDYGDGSYSGSLVQFMSEGNIRISPECAGINLSVKPNRAQELSLSDFVSRNRGEVLLDIDDPDGYTVVSVEYPRGTHANKVLNDIRGWFDNGTKPEVSITSQFRSLSNAGEQHTSDSLSALRLDAPVAKNATTAPTVADNATVQEKTQLTDENSTGVTAADMQELFPDDAVPVQAELERLDAHRKQLYSALEAAVEHGSANDVGKLAEEYEEVNSRIKELEQEEAERTGSLTDAPPEMDAPFYGEPSEPTAPEDPFAERDISDAGKRSVNAYQYENPEVKPFFQEAALGMLYDVRNTTKGEKWYNDELYYSTGGEQGFGGTKRHTTDDIAELKDVYGYTYDQIEKGLNAIIKDDGAENNAVSKRIEFMLNDRLLNGYTDIDGRPYEPNQGYIRMLNEKQITEYSKEAFDSFIANADAYAPPADDVAPVKTLKQATPDTMDAPIFESKDKNAVKGQTTMFEPPKPNPKVANVLTEESAIAKEKSGIGTKLVSALVDKGMVFENLSLKTGNHELQAKWNYTLPSHTEARAQHFMEKGAKGVKPLKDIKKTVDKSGKADDFFNYLYHVHNIDRMTLEDRFGVENKTVFGETVTADVSRRKVAQYERTNPEFKSWANDVYAYNRHLRQLLVKGNVISQETANLWEKMYPHYVPIRRVDSKGNNISVPLDTNKTGVNNPIKRAIGGSSDIQPVFSTMAQRTEQTYRAIARNAFGIELKNTLGTTINSQKNTTGVDEAIDTIVAQEDHLLKPGTMTSNPTFTVFENGEKVEFEITEDMFDALKPAGKVLGHRSEAVTSVSEWRRNLLTTWNPVFALYRNPIKDLQDVGVNSQHPVKTYANVPNAIYQIATGGKWAQEYHQNGGKSNTYFDSRNNQFKAEDSVFKKTIGMPLKALEAAGEFIEEIPRLAEYIASRQDGRSVERSMLDAARVTTNFAAGGDFTKFLNSHGFTFLNASVQGASQHVRNFREAKQQGLKGYVKVLAKYTVAGLPGILLNNLLWDDDEEYEELNDYVKQNYYVIAKTEDGKFIRIPKGRTAAVMQNAMEQMEHLVTGDDEADFSTFYELFMNNIAPNNPIENNILAPIWQAKNNEAWYGGDLVPSRLQKLPAEEQFDESTDAISKWLGEKTGSSPYKINYLIDQYSGGLGDMFLPMLTPEAESGDNSFMGNILAPWKKELTTDSVLNNRNPGDFYELRDKLEVLSNSKNATEEDKMRIMYMDSVSWEMSDLYAKKRETQNSDLPDDEKYETVREIQEEINELAKNALNNYNHVEITGLYSEAGDKRYNLDAESGKWYEIKPKNADGSDNWYYQKEQEVTKGLGISYEQYWNNREEYNYAYDKPGKYALAQAVGGYDSYMRHYDVLENWQSDSYLSADKDSNGNSISGSRKEKVIDYINGLDEDYGTKIILYRSVYESKADKKAYNQDIIDYLNERDDISYEQMEYILKELGFDVDSEGYITW